MSEETLRKVVLAARPKGFPSISDFRMEAAPIPAPGEREVLLAVRYLSLDPYMRGRMNEAKSYVPATPLGGVMPGESVGTVIVSNCVGLAPGDLVTAFTGWCTHAVVKGEGLRKLSPSDAPVTTALGVLGMPGFTAYSGLKLIGRPKRGETVAVAAASGPVGSLVGQLARMGGARAVGIAGGAEKCDYVREELGFDAAVDHRGAGFADKLAAACPGGIDVYFENVGGAVWQAVLPLLNDHARIPVCGLIAQYNADPDDPASPRLASTMRATLSKRLLIQGFINYDFMKEHFEEFLREVGPRVADGSLKHKEDVVDGLEKAPEAFIGMMTGKNFGKLLVRVAE